RMSPRFKLIAPLAALATALIVAACSEDVQGGSACPLLCPQDQPPLQEVILDAITYDTSIASFPDIGVEPTLILAHAGDTLDARIITRYDTLPTKYTFSGNDSTITHLDSAWIQAVRVPGDSVVKRIEDSATIEVYDVTGAGNDTTAATLNAQFIPANKIGSLGLKAGDNPDTLRIPVDTNHVLARIQDSTHKMRVGVRLVSTGSAELRLISQNLNQGLRLQIKPNMDTSVHTIDVGPSSDYPTALDNLRGALMDFGYVASGRAMPAATLRVGGLPSRRVLLKFKVPAAIVDSSAVIRATLFMTQRRAPVANGGDTIMMRPAVVLSSSLITNPHLALEFAGVQAQFPTDSVRLVPKDSGLRKIDVVQIVRSWRGQDTVKTPRAIALVLDGEGTQAAGIDFFSIEAPVGVRPQLRITYATKPSSGRP
ncbi:MAG TPA: hypothetical protein VIV65_00615, partial [Gemmatimonadaceae bacterium]